MYLADSDDEPAGTLPEGDASQATGHRDVSERARLRGALVFTRKTRDSQTASDASESVVRIREKDHTLPPGPHDAVGLVGVGTGADRLAHAALSPHDPASTCLAHAANQLVAAFYKLTCPNPYRRFADTTVDKR